MSRDEILQALRLHLPDLRRRFEVEHLYLFGSNARGEAGPDSDIDILVEFHAESTIGLFGFARLQASLEGILGARVDLVTRGSLKPRLRDRILGELVLAA